VPSGAVVTDQSRKLVTVKEDGTVEPKVVRPGPMTEDGLRIIRSGLEAATASSSTALCGRGQAASHAATGKDRDGGSTLSRQSP
jgi:hypothetical protein